MLIEFKPSWYLVVFKVICFCDSMEVIESVYWTYLSWLDPPSVSSFKPCSFNFNQFIVGLVKTDFKLWFKPFHFLLELKQDGKFRLLILSFHSLFLPDLSQSFSLTTLVACNPTRYSPLKISCETVKSITVLSWTTERKRRRIYIGISKIGLCNIPIGKWIHIKYGSKVLIRVQQTDEDNLQQTLNWGNPVARFSQLVSQHDNINFWWLTALLFWSAKILGLL